MNTGTEQEPQSIKLYNPAELVTIIVNTSYIPSCPSVHIIREAIQSLMEAQPELLACRMLIVCDTPPPKAIPNAPPTGRAKWTGYLHNLKMLIKSDPSFKNGELIVTKKWVGLPGATVTAFKHIKTRLVLNYQHDWAMVGTVNTQGIIRTLIERKEVQLIRFYKKEIREGGTYLHTLVPMDGYDIPIIKVSAWSANPHFATTKHYRKVIIPGIEIRQPSGLGLQGMESTTNRRYQDLIKKIGFKKAHAKFGCYLYGRIGEGPFVRHMDGRQRYKNKDGSKVAFIDCGGHDGCTVRKLLEQPDPPHSTFSFEPHPKYADCYKNLPTFFYPKAVWIQDGEIMLYPGGKHLEGSSVCPSKSNVDLNKGFKVECVDLNQWMRTNIVQFDHVILKLDIEGAEYKVLDYLLRKNEAILFIDELYVEWHWPKHPVTTPEFHNKLIERLDAIGLHPQPWDALPWRSK